jgi:uncharacterized 2Fe-2S/4Fe-4S cluster protein (DUF4445 family)
LGKVQVIFMPGNKRIQVPKNMTIMNAARGAGVKIDAPCNGEGTCGKCKVKVKDELEVKSKLACKAVIEGNIEVFIQQEETFKTIETGEGTEILIKSNLNLKPRDEILALAGEGQCLGIALDIGTTSVVATIYNLKTGEYLGRTSCLNPQTQFGGDVITRITHAKNPEGLLELQKAIIEGINSLIGQLTANGSYQSEDIYQMVVAANTTMLHLLKGVSPTTLAVAPYKAVFLDAMEVTAQELGINIAKEGIISLTPSASSFVGGDILAGLLAIDFSKHQGAALFIDIGTNGELAAIKEGQIRATSTAAGPALEGMNITFGCRAENGAIEEVRIDKQGNILLEVIGGEKPKGICGSGLIELTAELLRKGVILPSGRFNKKEEVEEKLAERMVTWQGQKGFLVYHEPEILLIQKDIRQIQLAKGAILAGINLLIKELELEYQEIEKVYIAGAFGYHLKPNALVTMGMIPKELKNKLSFVGNTAIEGAAAALLNIDQWNKLIELQLDTKVQELSIQPEFQQAFVESLNFPKDI